jgi:hypothetical protein
VLGGLAGVAMYQEHPLLAALLAAAALTALAGALISKRRAHTHTRSPRPERAAQRPGETRPRPSLLAALRAAVGKRPATSTNITRTTGDGGVGAGAAGGVGARLRGLLPAALGGTRGKNNPGRGKTSTTGSTGAGQANNGGSPFGRALAALTGGRLGSARTTPHGPKTTGTPAGALARPGGGRGLLGSWGLSGGKTTGSTGRIGAGRGPRRGTGRGLFGAAGGLGGGRGRGLGGGRGLFSGGVLPGFRGGRGLGSLGRGRGRGRQGWGRSAGSLFGDLFRARGFAQAGAAAAPGRGADPASTTRPGAGADSAGPGEPEVVTAFATRMDTAMNTPATTPSAAGAIGVAPLTLPSVTSAARPAARPSTPSPSTPLSASEQAVPAAQSASSAQSASVSQSSVPAVPTVVLGEVIGIAAGCSAPGGQVIAQKGTPAMSSAVARFDPTPYTAMIDRSTPATLQASLQRAAQLVRSDAVLRAEQAEALRAEAGRLPETPLTQEAAMALRAEAARLAEDAQVRIGWACGVEAQLSRLN